MKAFALAAPILVIGLMHLLQRLEAWALRESVPGVPLKPAPSPFDKPPAGSPLRQRDVPDHHAGEEASNHG